MIVYHTIEGDKKTILKTNLNKFQIPTQNTKRQRFNSLSIGYDEINVDPKNTSVILPSGNTQKMPEYQQTSPESYLPRDRAKRKSDFNLPEIPIPFTQRQGRQAKTKEASPRNRITRVYVKNKQPKGSKELEQDFTENFNIDKLNSNQNNSFSTQQNIFGRKQKVAQQLDKRSSSTIENDHSFPVIMDHSPQFKDRSNSNSGQNTQEFVNDLISTYCLKTNFKQLLNRDGQKVDHKNFLKRNYFIPTERKNCSKLISPFNHKFLKEIYDQDELYIPKFRRADSNQKNTNNEKVQNILAFSQLNKDQKLDKLKEKFYKRGVSQEQIEEQIPGTDAGEKITFQNEQRLLRTGMSSLKEKIGQMSGDVKVIDQFVPNDNLKYSPSNISLDLQKSQHSAHQSVHQQQIKRKSPENPMKDNIESMFGKNHSNLLKNQAPSVLSNDTSNTAFEVYFHFKWNFNFFTHTMFTQLLVQPHETLFPFQFINNPLAFTVQRAKFRETESNTYFPSFSKTEYINIMRLKSGDELKVSGKEKNQNLCTFIVGLVDYSMDASSIEKSLLKRIHFSSFFNDLQKIKTDSNLQDDRKTFFARNETKFYKFDDKQFLYASKYDQFVQLNRILDTQRLHGGEWKAQEIDKIFVDIIEIVYQLNKLDLILTDYSILNFTYNLRENQLQLKGFEHLNILHKENKNFYHISFTSTLQLQEFYIINNNNKLENSPPKNQYSSFISVKENHTKDYWLNQQNFSLGVLLFSILNKLSPNSFNFQLLERNVKKYQQLRRENKEQYHEIVLSLLDIDGTKEKEEVNLLTLLQQIYLRKNFTSRIITPGSPNKDTPLKPNQKFRAEQNTAILKMFTLDYEGALSFLKSNIKFTTENFGQDSFEYLENRYLNSFIQYKSKNHKQSLAIIKQLEDKFKLITTQQTLQLEEVLYVTAKIFYQSNSLEQSLKYIKESRKNIQLKKSLLNLKLIRLENQIYQQLNDQEKLKSSFEYGHKLISSQELFLIFELQTIYQLLGEYKQFLEQIQINQVEKIALEIEFLQKNIEIKCKMNEKENLDLQGDILHYVQAFENQQNIELIKRCYKLVQYFCCQEDREFLLQLSYRKINVLFQSLSQEQIAVDTRNFLEELRNSFSFLASPKQKAFLKQLDELVFQMKDLKEGSISTLIFKTKKQLMDRL